MYNLGEQFTFDYSKAIANKENIIQGENYRFTVLSERLIRMEYSEEGFFENRPTELVWYRNMPPVKFEKSEDSKYLQIKTKYFELNYVKNKSFAGSKLNPTANLNVKLLNTDRVWYYNHPEVRNYGAPSFSLDDNVGDPKLQKSLYSVDGFVSIDDSNTNVFTESGVLEKKESNSKDIYLFMYLKDFALCLKDYFSLTGYPNLIPRYALGNWWSRNTNYNEEQIKNLVNEFELNEIPLSILLLDKKWHITSQKNNGFTWNPDLFTNPKELISFIHSKNIEVGLNVNPLDGIYPQEKNYEILTNYLQKDEKGNIPFNVFDPKCIDAYLKILIHPLESDGVDFFWNDSEEVNKKNDLFVLNHYQFLDNIKNRRPMILTRNSSVAAHRYPVLYSGKTIVGWDTLKTLPYYNGCATNIGLTFLAHDVGGYYKGTEDNELYTRYVQLATFSPILKFGSEDGKYYKREPWKWGIKTYSIVKKYLNLRHRLIPYIYSECYKYSRYGMPLIIPLYYNVPTMYDDLNFRNEYFFGNELFICPITTKKEYLINRVIHKFYLPEGVWYDFVNGKKFIGGRKHLSFFNDEDYPVFAKAGSIVTLSNDDELNSTKPPKNLEIQIFPGRTNTYKMYEDDGVTEAYKSGNYLLTAINYNYLPNNYTVIIRPLEGKTNIVPEVRNYKIVFRNTKEANDVIAYFNDTKIELKKYVKGTDFIIEIENVSTIGQLTLNCKGKNIEIDAARIINDDIESIISDLQIKTSLKEEIDAVFFSNLPIKKKRIEVRKLANKGLEKNFVKLFLKLLEYIDQIYR